jgi:hypothetical protein
MEGRSDGSCEEVVEASGEWCKFEKGVDCILRDAASKCEGQAI